MGLGLNRVVMMTVHDHIEGSFGVGPIRRARRARGGGIGTRGRIRAEWILFPLGLS